MPHTHPVSDDDTPALIRDLSRHRWMAGGCLALAAGGWVVSHVGLLPPGAALPLRAVAEAGMVGGLADWFAVTALFRRPLGLPIPHTALVPRNRDRIADGIAAYIDREFLDPEMLVEQIRRMDPASHIAKLLAEEAAQAKLVDLIADLLPGLLRADGEAPVLAALGRALSAGLAEVDLRPTLAQALRALVASDALEPLLREAADRLIHLVHTRRTYVEAAVAGKSRWWMPSSMDKSLADTINEALLGHLWDLRSPHSPAGQDLRAWLMALPDEVADGSPLAERMMDALRGIAGPDAIGPVLEQILSALRQGALADLEKPDGRIRSVLTAVAGSVAAEMQAPALRARINQGVEAAFRAAMPRWRVAIRDFVAATLKAQDVTDFTQRLELRVGRDLQYIRINGTILGAVIGGVLYAVNGWLG